MEVYLSRHARNRMRKFRISPEEASQAIEAAECIEPTEKGRQNAWKKKDDKYIRVTYLGEEERSVVVTVTLKDRLPRGGRG